MPSPDGWNPVVQNFYRLSAHGDMVSDSWRCLAQRSFALPAIRPPCASPFLRFYSPAVRRSGLLVNLQQRDGGGAAVEGAAAVQVMIVDEDTMLGIASTQTAQRSTRCTALGAFDAQAVVCPAVDATSWQTADSLPASRTPNREIAARGLQ